MLSLQQYIGQGVSPSCYRVRVGVYPEQVYSRANTGRQTTTHAHTHLVSPIHLTWKCLDCWRKPAQLHGEHANSTYKGLLGGDGAAPLCHPCYKVTHTWYINSQWVYEDLHCCDEKEYDHAAGEGCSAPPLLLWGVVVLQLSIHKTERNGVDLMILHSVKNAVRFSR